MNDYFLKFGKRFTRNPEPARRNCRKGAIGRAKTNIFILSILAFGAGIFFYVFFGANAAAVKFSGYETAVDVEKIDPLARIGKSSFSKKSESSFEKETAKNEVPGDKKEKKVSEEKRPKKEKADSSKEKVKPEPKAEEAPKKREDSPAASQTLVTITSPLSPVSVSFPAPQAPGTVNVAELDPMAKLGSSSINISSDSKSVCSVNPVAENGVSPEVKQREDELRTMVSGYPIEEMVPFIARRDKATGSYLVAIAKKESDWGKHTPKKDGRECFNFWGFKGGYNPTESGYSCFDNPEQAIQMVGDRIGSLVEKKVDTPERMVVWKCGSSCAGHDPGSVKKWISDVGSYYYKLNS